MFHRLMTEIIKTYETSVNFFHTSRSNNPEESHLLNLIHFTIPTTSFVISTLILSCRDHSFLCGSYLQLFSATVFNAFHVPLILHLNLTILRKSTDSEVPRCVISSNIAAPSPSLSLVHTFSSELYQLL